MFKKHFHKILPYFRVYVDFECSNKREDSHIGYKTTKFLNQNPTCNGFCLVSELNIVLQSVYRSCFSENNVEWFVDEVIKTENKMKFYFEKTKKDFVMTREDEDDFNSLDGRGVGDHCHLTGKYRGAAHEKFTINVKQKQ